MKTYLYIFWYNVHENLRSKMLCLSLFSNSRGVWPKRCVEPYW